MYCQMSLCQYGNGFILMHSKLGRGHGNMPYTINSWDIVVENNMILNIIRADSRFAPSQWDKALLYNDVSHWLGANLESAQIVLKMKKKLKLCSDHKLAKTCYGVSFSEFFGEKIQWHIKSMYTVFFAGNHQGNTRVSKEFISASLHNSVFLINLWRDVSSSLLQLNMIYEGQ